MSKICTDLEQSRKLVELGLDLETSDAHWWPNGNGFQLIPISFKNDSSVPEFVAKEVIPAWSLSALLELIPDFNMFKRTIECRIETTNHLIDKACNPIDAAFDMIVWLLENKHIK